MMCYGNHSLFKIEDTSLEERIAFYYLKGLKLPLGRVHKLVIGGAGKKLITLKDFKGVEALSNVYELELLHYII